MAYRPGVELIRSYSAFSAGSTTLVVIKINAPVGQTELVIRSTKGEVGQAAAWDYVFMLLIHKDLCENQEVLYLPGTTKQDVLAANAVKMMR